MSVHVYVFYCYTNSLLAFNEFTSTKIPGRVSSSGYPFKPIENLEQPPSPALNYLFNQLALSLPGFNTITPELWQEGAQGLLERLAAQDLSDSFDKGLLGKRKILGQGIIVIVRPSWHNTAAN